MKMPSVEYQGILKKLRANDPGYIALDLSEQAMSSKELRQLARALAKNTELRSMILKKNALGDAGATVISQILTNESSGIASLDLSDNEMTDVGAAVLAAAIKKNTHLTEFLFGDNKLSTVGHWSLTEVMLEIPHMTRFQCKNSDTNPLNNPYIISDYVKKAIKIYHPEPSTSTSSTESNLLPCTSPFWDLLNTRGPIGEERALDLQTAIDQSMDADTAWAEIEKLFNRWGGGWSLTSLKPILFKTLQDNLAAPGLPPNMAINKTNALLYVQTIRESLKVPRVAVDCAL